MDGPHRLRTVFFGTPEWSVPSLEALVESGHDVAAVVTNPDRRSGRGMSTHPSPVKRAAERAGIPVLQPQGVRDAGFRSTLAELAPDVGTVVAYGKILPAALLEVPRLGFVNVHFSLLPAYRGAAPVHRAIMDGATETGVSIMLLTEGMDEGPVLARTVVGIDPEDTSGSLGERLSAVGAELLVPALEGYADGSLEPREQEHAGASYAPKVTDEDARVDWGTSSEAIRNLVRAMTPAPGAWTTLRGRRVRIGAVAPRAARGELAPGELRAGRQLIVGTGDGAVAVVSAQMSGRRWMDGADLARGLRLLPGERFV